MGIDVMKTCHQWAKDHLMVSGVLIFFYLLYIFLPSIFSILFYSFPLAICSAILIGNNKPNINKDDQVQMYAVLPHSTDIESEDEGEGEGEGEKKAVVEWTEDDERNVREVGSLEIERNKRLEKLMEKRMAKKIESMQPRRSACNTSSNNSSSSNYYMNNNIESLGVRPLMLVRPRASRNPFDLPYDSHEERPILRGGSFEEELFAHVLKDLPISGRHEGFSFIPKPLPPSKLASSLFTDLEENVKKKEGKKEEELDLFINNNKCGYTSSSSMSASSRTSRKSRSSRKSRRSARNKTLTCLVVVPSNCPTGKGKSSSSTNIELVSNHSSGTGPGPQAQSRSQHRNSCSIASDMQVEVSEGGSPSLGPLDPSSPTDRESLVYDGDDEERDVNSGDEDFWVNSPHPRGSSMALLPPRPVMQGVDQSSTHADIIESRPSVASSSSESLSSQQQQQSKAQHLADFLASLDPLDIQSNQIQSAGSHHVGEESAEEIRELSHGRGPSEISKGSSSASNECVTVAVADQNQHSEDDESRSVITVTEQVLPKEVICDSLSTASGNDIIIHEEECSYTEKAIATPGEHIHVVDRDETSKDSKVSLPDSNV